MRRSRSLYIITIAVETATSEHNIAPHAMEHKHDRGGSMRVDVLTTPSVLSLRIMVG